MQRKERIIAGLALGAFACLGTAPSVQAGIPGGAQFFLDPIQFEQTLADIGKVSKAQWDFKPDHLPPGAIVAVDDLLDINTHPVNAPGVWLDAAGVDLWPPEVDNVVFSANQNPGGTLVPFGPGGLFYAKNGVQGLDNNMLGSNLPQPSFDIISGPPAGDNHTAISFDLLQLNFGGPPPIFQVTVFNKDDIPTGVFTIDGGPLQKIFLGILAPPGDTIGRVDIWDITGGFEGISRLALYQQPGQPPACPGDCAFPPDKVVNVVDFLAMLAQWGGPGSCDLNGDGIVNIQDFLLLLAFWGPCPAPGNDECVDKIFIERLDPAGEITIPFDMYGATPSPEPIQCIGAPNPWKDIWYCLRNVTDTKKLVTVTGTVDLALEVTAGCVCPPPPGSVVACGILFAGVSFPLQPGEEVCLRLLNDLELPNDELKGNLIITNEPIQVDPVNFYLDFGQFEQAAFEAGKFIKAIWNFKPDHLPVGAPGVPVDDVLDITTHPVNAPGVWLDAAGTDLWPPEVDNVQFSSNLTPQGPLTPRGPQGLAYWKALAPPPNIDNNALVANFFVDSFDIISGPPAGDNHTGIAFEVLQLPNFNFPAPVFNITVYDKNDLPIGNLVITAVPGEKIFVGILTKDPAVTIGRVDIWDQSGGAEGISFIALYQQFGPVCDIPFICGGPIEECIPGANCICLQGFAGDVFCGDSTTPCTAPQCPNGDIDCPPGSRCAVDTCCGFPVCVPVCFDGAAPVEPVTPDTGPTAGTDTIVGGANN